MSDLIPFLFRMTRPQHDFVRREAESLGLDRAELLRRVIDEYRMRAERSRLRAAAVADHTDERADEGL